MRPKSHVYACPIVLPLLVSGLVACGQTRPSSPQPGVDGGPARPLDAGTGELDGGCAACRCDDDTCPIDEAGDCSDGLNCLTQQCSVCRCDDGTCTSRGDGVCADGYNCFTGRCLVCPCDDNVCSDSQGTCPDQTNCLDLPDGGRCECLCDDGTCPTNSAGDCTDGYNCVASQCIVCVCDDESCSDLTGNCADGTDCLSVPDGGGDGGCGTCR